MADLPKHIELRLKGVEESCRRARHLSLTLLVVATYIFVTAFPISDEDLITQAKQLSLPLLDVQVGLVYFLPISGLLLAVLHLNHMFHVNQLASRMSSLCRTDYVRFERRAMLDSITPFVTADAILAFVARRSWLNRLKSSVVLLLHLLPLAVLYFQALLAAAYPGPHRMLMVWILWPLLGVTVVVTLRSALRLALALGAPDLKRPTLAWVATLVILVLVVGSVWSASRGSIDVRSAILVQSAPSSGVVQDYVNRGQTVSDAWQTEAVGLDLGRFNLKNANLKRSRLWNAVLPRQGLQGATLDHVTLNGARFADPRSDQTDVVLDLRLAGLSHADLARLESLDLDAARVRHDFDSADFSGANLYKSRLVGLSLREAKFRGSNLREADLRFADLRFADFTGADLTDADMRWALLDGATFSRCQLMRCKLEGASLARIRLGSSRIRGARLKQWKSLLGDVGFCSGVIPHGVSETEIGICIDELRRLRANERSDAAISRLNPPRPASTEEVFTGSLLRTLPAELISHGEARHRLYCWQLQHVMSEAITTGHLVGNQVFDRLLREVKEAESRASDENRTRRARTGAKVIMMSIRSGSAPPSMQAWYIGLAADDRRKLDAQAYSADRPPYRLFRHF